MLPKNKRLNKGDIEKVLKRGRSIDASLFRLKGVTEADSFAFSPIVSKKVSKSAVSRNKIKRIVFNLIKELSFDNKKYKGVLFVKKNILEIPKEDLVKELKTLFSKI
jgi:ribonuclease P protein component